MFVFHGEIPWHSHYVHGIPWLTYISHYSGTYPAIFPYFFLKFPNHQKFGAWTAFMACEWEFCQQMRWKNGSKWSLTSQEVNLTKQRWEFNYHKWELNGNRTQLSNITYLKISWWFTFKKNVMFHCYVKLTDSKQASEMWRFNQQKWWYHVDVLSERVWEEQRHGHNG